MAQFKVKHSKIVLKHGARIILKTKELC